MLTIIAILVGALGFGNYLLYVEDKFPRPLHIGVQLVFLVIVVMAWFAYHGPKMETWSSWSPGWTVRRGIQFLAMLGLLVTTIMMVLKLK
jgi:hypothetical protein